MGAFGGFFQPRMTLFGDSGHTSPTGGGRCKRSRFGSRLQALVCVEQHLVVPVGHGEPDVDLASVVDDGRSDVHEGVAETLPFPPHRLGWQCDLGQPALEVVRQPGAAEPGRVGQKVPDGHPHGSDAALELLDDVLLVTAAVRKVQHVLGGVCALRQVGQGEAVSPDLEEIALAVGLVDPLTSDDQPVGALQTRDVVLALGDPLPRQEKVLLLALQGLLATQVGPPRPAH